MIFFILQYITYHIELLLTVTWWCPIKIYFNNKYSACCDWMHLIFVISISAPHFVKCPYILWLAKRGTWKSVDIETEVARDCLKGYSFIISFSWIQTFNTYWAQSCMKNTEFLCWHLAFCSVYGTDDMVFPFLSLGWNDTSKCCFLLSIQHVYS